MKLNSPDYQGVESEEALRDFRERMKYYEDKYQPLEMEGVDADRSFVKVRYHVTILIFSLLMSGGT